MEVISRKTRATFFKDEVTGRPMVLIKAIGDPNSIIQKVEPRHIVTVGKLRQFKRDAKIVKEAIWTT